MRDENSHPYFIARSAQRGEEHFCILFYPVPNVFREPSPMVAVVYGWMPGTRQGPCLEPDKMLEWAPSTFYEKSVNGKLWEPGPPGWFRRQCEAAGCLWFFGLVERMAAGEEVSIEEIKATYRENNGGKELEQKPIYELV